MKHILLVYSIILISITSGCTFKSGDELLKAPKPSATYESLQKQINNITSKGAIPVSPQSGENRNTVQLMDLDLDGEDEAIAFFCETNNPDKFHVYVFRKKNSEYISVGSISGRATQINSVSYPILSPDGKRGILISWKISSDDSTSGITICSFSNEKLSKLLDTTFQAFITYDLDNNGTDDIVLFTKNDTGRRVARLYVSNFEQNKLSLKGETMLSPETQSIVRLKGGLLRGYQAAIFAESKVKISTGLMTDILTYDKEGFRNITLESEEVLKHSTYRPVSVPATDVNNDMVTEVPLALTMPTSKFINQTQSGSDPSYMLDWYAYSTGDAPVRVCTTYQNVSENWQILVPDTWRSKIIVSKLNGENKTSTTFWDNNLGNVPIELFTIHRLTGDMRSYYASQNNMLEIIKTATEIYCVSIPQSAKNSILSISFDQIKERFSIISQSWSN